MATQFPDPIPGILPFGTVTLFGGAPAAGKTTMLAQWAVCWRDGTPICGHPTTTPTAIMVVSADRQWASNQQCFAKAGFPDVPHYSVTDTLTASDRTKYRRSPELAFELFEQAIKALRPPPGTHLFVDPVSPLFIPGDPNRQRDVAWALLDFQAACRQHQITITAVLYFGKQKTDRNDNYQRPMDRIAGSTAFTGYSDTQVYLMDDTPDGESYTYHTLGWNPRHSPAEAFKFVRDTTTGLFRPFNEYERIQTEQDRPDQLLSLIPDDGIKTKLLVAMAQAQFAISESTVYRELKALVAQGLIERDANSGRLRRRKFH